MMTLFEDESLTTKYWDEVCPNADDFNADETEGMHSFNAMLHYLREWDRVQVARVLHKAQASRAFLLMVLNNSLRNNAGLQFCARELLYKVSDKLLCSVMAFSHDAGGRHQVVFPDKKKNIPRSLYSAFGLRSNEEHWFERLAANEDFVRLIAKDIKNDDWKYIIHDKGILFKNTKKEDTEPQLVINEQDTLW